MSAVIAPPRRAVAALAGRRIDAMDADIKRFPLNRVDAVKDALAELIRVEQLDLLVCSAACGADLLALEAALSHGVRCRVVLPYDPAEFRRTSVMDRPGEWGTLYDRVVASVGNSGDLVVLVGPSDDARAYSRANEAIVLEASVAAKPGSAIAILVWEGQPRDGSDATAEFRQLALDVGMIERTVLTCAA